MWGLGYVTQMSYFAFVRIVANKFTCEAVGNNVGNVFHCSISTEQPTNATIHLNCDACAN